jgi:hypothetical protein
VDIRTAIVRTFLTLRPNGVPLGVSEMLAAVRLVDEGFVDPDDSEEVVRGLRLLWCKSETDEWHLRRVWASIEAAREQPSALTPPPSESAPLPQPPVGEHRPAQWEEQIRSGQPAGSDAPELGFLPFRPSISLSADTPQIGLQSYWPVSRRFMAYIWRYLHRPVQQGKSGLVDLTETVEAAARRGFLTEPVYRTRTVNAARVLLLFDHRGSMMPFHRYLRDMVETLTESDIQPENRAVYYFENVPGTNLFRTPYLTKPVETEQALQFVDSATAVLIVSDAGAARGRPRQRRRVQGTLDFLFDLFERTRFVAWLNPMPRERWQNTSAEAIASYLPMFPMDEHGFSHAVDILSGRVTAPHSWTL